MDVHPPLFFLFLHVAGLAYTPEWVTRVVMVAIGAASVAIFFALVKLWAGERAAVVAALCAAFMPMLIFYDTWVRMYVAADALGLTQLLLLSVIVRRADIAGVRRRLLWFGWVLACILAVYTIYLAWFLVIAQVLFVAVLYRSQLLRATAGACAVIIAFLPQVQTMLSQMQVGGITFRGFQSSPLASILSLPGQMTIAPQLEGTAFLVCDILAWVWLAAALWGVLTYAPRSLLPWLAVPAILTIVYNIAANKLIYIDRYFLICSYAVAAWTGCLYSVARERPNAALVKACYGLVAALVVFGCIWAVDPNFYTADWPGATQIIEDQAQPGDFIVLEQGMSMFDVLRVPSIARIPSVQVWHPDQVNPALSAAEQHKRVWVVAYEPRGIDPNLVLLNELGKRYRAVSIHRFNRYLPAEDIVLILFVRGS